MSRVNIRVARALLNRAIGFDPSCALAHIVLASVLKETDEYEASLKHYQTAARLRPSDPEPEIAMGHVYLLLGWREEALIRAQECFRRWPAEPAMRYNVGLCHLPFSEYAQAADWLEQELELWPAQPATRALLGWTYAAGGRYDDARREQSAVRQAGRRSLLTQRVIAMIDVALADVHSEALRADALLLALVFYSTEHVADPTRTGEATIDLRPDAP